MDIQKLMRQAQKMQSDLAKIEEEINQAEYTGTSGGAEGVSVTVNGKFEVQEVRIPEELMEKDSREMLQDMLLIAMNEAVSAARKDREDRIGAAAGGLNLPGM